MLQTLILVASLLPAIDPGDDVRSVPVADRESSASIRNAGSAWDGSGQQFAVGLLGGVVGTFGGLFVGAFVGSVLIPEHSGPPPSEDALYYFTPHEEAVLGGAIIGAVVGEIAGTGLLAWKAAPAEYPSRHLMMPMMGAFIGCLAGGIAGEAVKPNSGDVIVGAWIGSALGATLMDRIASKEAGPVSLDPWLPKPGLVGARLSCAF